jgi:hypothetical protein
VLLLAEQDILDAKLLSVCFVCRISGTVCDEGGEVYSAALGSGINLWLTVQSQQVRVSCSVDVFSSR